MERRKFLGGSALFMGSLMIPKQLTAISQKELQLLPHPNPSAALEDETYWDSIRLLFEQPRDYINLENGYFSPMALPTLSAHQKFENQINTRTSWFMRRDQEAAIHDARHSLAEFLGCNEQELALTRNTTESLNIVIAGFPWKKGDEVVIGDQDYGSMVAAFRQAERRHGIVVKTAKIPLHPKSDQEVVDAYLSHMGPKTRLVHITHLINLTGHIVPVTAIANAAHNKGALVAVDAAHSVAQVPFFIADLNADFVGASLHKWLSNALGTGLLWVKKEYIKDIWPLMADGDFDDEDIRKFEHQGTRPIHSLQTIPMAIRLHQTLGGEIKFSRLKYLMRLWCSMVDIHPKIHVLTPWNDEQRNSAIATVRIDGIAPDDLAKKLLKDFNIFTVAINHPVINGVRVTPHIFTKPEDCQLLGNALLKIADGQ